MQNRTHTLGYSMALGLALALSACGSEESDDAAGGAQGNAGGQASGSDADGGVGGGSMAGGGNSSGNSSGNSGGNGGGNGGATPPPGGQGGELGQGGEVNQGGQGGQGGDLGQGGQPLPGGAGGEPGPALPTWGEESPGVTVGPFVEFHAFRSGCGEQIWGRWIPEKDFALGEVSTHVPGAGTNTTSFFETPVFIHDQKTVYLVDPAGGFGEGDYTFDFTVGYENGSTLTHSLSAPAERLYRWDGQFDLLSARADAGGELHLTLSPHIGGRLYRIFAYDAATECLAGSETFFDGLPFEDGVDNEFSFHLRLNAGTAYTVVLQGYDAGRNYDFYATLDVTGP